MANPKNEEITEANERISRPDDKKLDRGREGKVFAGQRAEFAADPVGDEGSKKSETEKAAERASRNDRK